MTNTIEALWKYRDSLWPPMGESQRELARGYTEQMGRYTLRMMELAFRDGFCAGMQLLSEGLCGV